MTESGIWGASLIDYLPFGCFSKDLNSHYSYINQTTIKSFLFKDKDEVIGKSDFDMPWKEDAELFQEKDKLTLVHGKPQSNLEVLPKRDGTKCLHLDHKIPMFSKTGEIEGLAGVGLILNPENFKHLIPFLAFSGINISDYMYSLNGKKIDIGYGDIDFSKRQAQIISCLLRGHSAESTAKELNLSKRTIEFYLVKIKEKLNCKNKSEIISKSFELGFIDLMFMKLN